MNFSMLKSIQRAVNTLVKKVIVPKTLQLDFKGVHQFCNQQLAMSPSSNSSNIIKPIGFLMPTSLQFNQVCGMKQKGQLQLRCKGCYLVQRQGRMYVMCHLKPRHKQMQMQKKFLNRAILTFAHQKKVRDWW